MRAVTRFPGSRMVTYDRIGERKLNVVVGAADPHPVLLCLLTVQLGHTITFGECRRWVDSCRLAKSYIDSVC